MIFLDSSGIYALADRDDAKHDEAVRSFQAAGRSGERFVTHSYVLVESAALIQRRLELAQALSFLREADKFIVRWVLPELHSEAVDYLAKGREIQAQPCRCREHPDNAPRGRQEVSRLRRAFLG